MALEPTEDQLRAIIGEFLRIDMKPGVVPRLWALIRDMVLEAAAQVCDRVHEGGGCDDEAFVCAERIRALKGKQ